MPQCGKSCQPTQPKSCQPTHTTHQVTKGEILRVIHGHKTDGWWKWCDGGRGEGGSGNIDNTSPLICKYQANKRTTDWAKSAQNVRA